MELESLLSHAYGLKELILEEITFDNLSRPADLASHEALVVLDSFQLHSYGHHQAAEDVVDAMLSTFSKLDIRHLRSLHVAHAVPLLPLLRANARTLQRIQYFQRHRIS
jgi:hypothetical protein